LFDNVFVNTKETTLSKV